MSSGPKYLQIAEDVRASVTNGDYRPAQTLPAEREFMERFSVSRITVRRALKEPVDESLLESRQGSGFVVQSLSHLNQSLNRVTSFAEDCLSRGLTPGSILISRKPGRSTPEESAHFDVPENSPRMLVIRAAMLRIIHRLNIHTAGSGLSDGPSPMKSGGSP